MRVLVLGAGVTGLATAWYLRQDGHQVTVVERNQAVALEASFANGGQLSYSYVTPLAGPGVLSKLPLWLLRKDSPVRFSPRLDLEQWRWIGAFVGACSQRRSDLATKRLLALSFFSRALMEELLGAQPGMRFDQGNTGKLVVFRGRRAFEAARRLLDYQRALGCEQALLDPTACVTLEPALADLAPHLQGGVFTPSEGSGDCHQFCREMARLLRARGVDFMLDTTVTRLARGGSDDRRLYAYAGQERIDAEQIVLATGAASVSLLRPLGIRVPLYPIAGYSLTARLAHGHTAPRVSVTDFERKIVYARLGDRLRVAGMADLGARRAGPDPARVASLRAAAAEAFPRAGDFDAASAWHGLRPATPTSTPIISATRYENLWLNVGQGALGFTLALGSGRLIGDLMANRQPSISRAGFGIDAEHG